MGTELMVNFKLIIFLLFIIILEITINSVPMVNRPRGKFLLKIRKDKKWKSI